MNKILAAMLNILKYAPYAIAGAQAVETAVGASNGAAKKQAVLAAILGAVHVGETVPVTQVAAISSVVDLVVGTLNVAGVFGKVAPSVVVPKAELGA